MTLQEIAKKMCAKGKGILAADESTGTIAKRFKSINVENTEKNRLIFRQTLFSSEAMKNYIGGVPKVMELKEVLGEFLSFRREIIIKRTEFDLKEAEARAHILEGLTKALESIDEIISLIKKSNNPEEAKEKLINYSSGPITKVNCVKSRICCQKA